MTTKNELSRRIVTDMLNEQRNPTPFSKRFDTSVPLSFPPQLPIGNGRFISVTKDAISDIREFGNILRSNDKLLALSHSDEEISKIVGRAFGGAFAEVDIDQPDDDVHEQTLALVLDYISQELAPGRHQEEFAFGCWALTGPGTDDIKIGPIRFEAREIWLVREEALGRISKTAVRRIQKTWSGCKSGSRVASVDAEKEQMVLETVSECATVCSVATKGLSQKIAQYKAPLAARLALTALALSWETPSKALARMGLLLDGPIYTKRAISFAPKHMSGLFRQVSHIGGQFVTSEWPSLWSSLDWLVGPIGDALRAYVQIDEPSIRPKISNAVFMSLWWFHEACREEAPLLAIVKYAASLDALAGGGKSRGIQELVNARLSIKPGNPLMKDGRTTQEVVKEIYDDARSRALHGSIDRHGHDWQQVRSTAESLARLCLNLSCDWISNNPNSDDLAALRRTDH